MIDPSIFIAFNAIANRVSGTVGDIIIDLAEREALGGEQLVVGEQYFATIVGSATACLKVLDAAVKAGAISDGQKSFDLLLRQMADIWGQLAHEPAAGGTVQ